MSIPPGQASGHCGDPERRGASRAKPMDLEHETHGPRSGEFGQDRASPARCRDAGAKRPARAVTGARRGPAQGGALPSRKGAHCRRATSSRRERPRNVKSLRKTKNAGPARTPRPSFLWCRGRDSNPHGGSPRAILSRHRLPVPTPRLEKPARHSFPICQRFGVASLLFRILARRRRPGNGGRDAAAGPSGPTRQRLAGPGGPA